MTVEALRDSKLWVPMSAPMLKRAKKEFTVRIYDEKQCNNCEYRPDRHCDICDECEFFKGKYKLWSKKEIDGTEHLGLPVGRPEIVRKVVKDDIEVTRIKPKSKYKRFRHDIQFTAKLWDNQLKPIKEMIKAKRGILLSPPRSGKTVMFVKIATKLKFRTLILASQIDWLEQFMDTIRGSKTQEPVTNVAEIEKFEGRKIVGICKTAEDMLKYDIALCTYQTFLSEGGKKKLAKIKDHFGLVGIDEVHDGGATEYLRVLSQLNSLYMIGLTGTYDRKDGKIVLPEFVVGTVKARGKGDTDVPTVIFEETGATYSGQHKMWTSAVTWLSNNQDRNAKIVKRVLADLALDRSIVIPVDRVAHARLLVNTINLAYQKIHKTDKKIAAEFTGQLRADIRKKTREDAKHGRIRVIVGIRKIIQVGLNIPRWDTIYEVIPISNPPKLMQETSRIRTKVSGKQWPLIRHFIEDFGISRGCLRTCMWQTYKPERFKISKEQMAIANRYMNKGKPVSYADTTPTIGVKLWK